MSSPEPERDDRPNPGARRYPRPGKPSLRAQAFWGAAVLVCCWLAVAASGLCTIGYMHLAIGPMGWRALFTLHGILNLGMLLLMFGWIPIVGTIVMVIATKRAIKNRRRLR